MKTASTVHPETVELHRRDAGATRVSGRTFSEPRTLGIDAEAVAAARATLADYLELTKIRLVSLVLFTTGIGFVVGHRGATDVAFVLALIHAVLGTALVACGSMAMNQVMERESDAMMSRTRHRPVVQGRIGVAEAWTLGLVLTGIGTLYLLLFANALAAGLALLTAVLYLAVYTPLKKITTFNTIVGAVSGAIPPMVGYAAAANHLGLPAWVLFGILFVWQIPHFLGIAWMYREDYARAGYVMLPVVDPSGVATSRQVLWFSLTLLLVSLLPTSAGMTGPAYFAAALLLGLAFVSVAMRAAIERDRRSARLMFLASVIYLPILLATMLAGAV